MTDDRGFTTEQTEESANAQRKRIEALAHHPELQQIAATARTRGPERSPQPETSGKQKMQRRLATMAKSAERDPETEQRIQEREKARKGADTKPARQGRHPMPAPWDDRRHANLPAPLANTRYQTAPPLSPPGRTLRWSS
ncbi:MAG: hypothetical protein OXJ62_14105 [Spirochaetaceae bacterium]|nr:hypothetical protein [Spirochaetaceae bacterium]